MQPIREYLDQLEETFIHHRRPEPENPLIHESPQQTQRRLIEEHDRRCGRTVGGPPTSDVIRRAMGDSSPELKARRSAVLEALRTNPEAAAEEVAAALGQPLLSIRKDIQALKMGGLI
ncbi:hypothetical protein [Mangrovicoccus ximenensis]|uniref:hypothetical protein n=1 Tax=Mangrovicoccus ximenensis TaxID=1911570 RepID=UPI0011AE8744|nr:hypothetical protein [Mangrovicoccus ximenensis]